MLRGLPGFNLDESLMASNLPECSALAAVCYSYRLGITVQVGWALNTNN